MKKTNGETGSSSERILDAALTLFSEKGYEGATTREICELAGITKPTLYYFYKSKDGVYRALIRAAMEEYASLVKKALAGPGTVRDRLKRSSAEGFEQTRRNSRAAKFLFAIVYSPSAHLVTEAHQAYRRIVRQIANEVDRGVRAGELRPGNTDVRVLVLMGALGESISNFLVTGKPKLTQQLAHSIIDSIFDSWQPASRTVHS